MKKLVILFLLLLSCSALADSSEITVSQYVDKSDIAYEDSVIFNIELQWTGSQMAYRFDKPLSPVIDGLKIRGFTSSVGSVVENGQEITTKKFRYVLIPRMAGYGLINPVEISYLSWPDSIAGELVTEPVSITVAKPIKKEEAESNFPLWILIPIIIVIAGMLIFVIFKRKSKQNDREIVLSPKEQFLADLNDLKETAKSDLKIYQSGLYKLLNDYFKTIYKFEFPEYNEDDFRDKMSHTKLSSEQIEQLGRWMEKAHKDKYLPIKATPGEVIRLDSEIRDFFEKI